MNVEPMDLSGVWLCRTDEPDIGIEQKWYTEDFLDHAAADFVLPGSACDNHIGKEQKWYDEDDKEQYKEAVRAPRERYEYIGPLWLQRELILTAEDVTADLQLYLERVNIASMLWVDGVQVAREIVELSAPHCYDLSGQLYHITEGRHLLTLRIDNRDLLHLSNMSSGYSIDTQGYWNGIIGKIELRRRPKVRLDDVQVFPSGNSILIHVITRSEQHTPMEGLPAVIQLQVVTPDGRELEVKKERIELFTVRQRNRFTYNLAAAGERQISHWNEFRPMRYLLKLRLITDQVLDTAKVHFGMRTVWVEDQQFMMDGRPVALRGTINCAQYPLTGYPPMDIDTWEQHFRVVKKYGMNHVRFHAWCPPEAAFEAADRLGIYLSVEMPLWLNRDVTPYELGDDPAHRSFFLQEARQIRNTYGNHPSFLMFSCGNENMGDYTILEDCVTQLKHEDHRCFYTLTSNFDHPVHECEDYLSSFEMGHKAARIQFLHDRVAEDTTLNYDDVISDIPVPAVAFEVGQYCIYPDVDCIERYTGNMMPVNFQVIRENMKKKKVYHRLREYIQASGDLAVKLYKEDIESYLRTERFGGFQLLSLNDYTGQNTATVGILDVFDKDKGMIDPAEWRGFCDEVVPLFQAKRIYAATECIRGILSIYDHGEISIKAPVYRMEIYHEGRLWYQHSYQAAEGDRRAAFEIPPDRLTGASLLQVYVTVEANGKAYRNRWRIFVYPERDAGLSPLSLTALQAAIGRQTTVLTTVETLAEYLGRETQKSNFVPVFWSPVWFATSDANGAIVDEKHPALAGFPTEHYPDYQWKDLLENGTAMDISGLELTPIIELVPNYENNTPTSPLFEISLQGTRVLACGFDLSSDALPAKALRVSMAAYLSRAAADKMK